LVSAVVAALIVVFLLGWPSELLPGPSRHTAPLVLPEGATPLPFFSSPPSRVPTATSAPSADAQPLPTSADVAFQPPAPTAALPDQPGAGHQPLPSPVTPRPQTTEAPTSGPLPVGARTPEPRITPITPTDAARSPAPIDPTKSPAPTPTDSATATPRPTTPAAPTPSRPPRPDPTPTPAPAPPVSPVSPCPDERVAPHDSKKAHAADDARCDGNEAPEMREGASSKPPTEKAGRPRHD